MQRGDPVHGEPQRQRSAGQLPVRRTASSSARRGLGLLDLQQLAGNQAVVTALRAVTAVPVQRSPRTAEVRKAIVRGDFSDTFQVPMESGGTAFELRGLSAADLAATLHGLRPEERELLRVGGYGLLVAPAPLRVRDKTALRAISATGSVAVAQRAVELVDALTHGRDFTPVLTGVDRGELYRVVSQVPDAQLGQLVRANALASAMYGPPTPLTHTLGLVLGDLTGGGGATTHATRADDVVDLASVRGAVNKRCATIYNDMGQFIAAEARRLGLSSAAVAALMIVESGGRAFGDGDRPIARFEVHVFDREWGAANAAVFRQHFRYTSWRGSTHYFREAAADPWERCHGNQAEEWQCIELASRLAGPEPAMRSASFGAGQVMGFNHARVGFASAVAMVAAFTDSMRAQVTAILSFISASPTLLAHAAAGRWLPVARAYNGSGQAASYAAKIARYHAAYARVTGGMAHHVP